MKNFGPAPVEFKITAETDRNHERHFNLIKLMAWLFSVAFALMPICFRAIVVFSNDNSTLKAFLKDCVIGQDLMWIGNTILIMSIVDSVLLLLSNRRSDLSNSRLFYWVMIGIFLFTVTCVLWALIQFEVIKDFSSVVFIILAAVLMIVAGALQFKLCKKGE